MPKRVKVKRIIRCSSQSKAKLDGRHLKPSKTQKKVTYEDEPKKHNPNALSSNYMDKLDRQHVLAAKERITI